MNRLFNFSTTEKRKALPLSVLLFVMLFMNSCSKEASIKPETSTTQSTMNKTSMLIPGDMLNNYSGLNATTLWEL